MSDNKNSTPNHLIHESSPYLLQHAYNPVQWYPWNEEALKKAKEEDKPIIVSIGYSACHWCHVMERESFENAELAAKMNEGYICIKVDREERPDIDQIYMDAVHAMGLQGGWPLNVFLTPEAKPFYGGTYFPPAGWGSILTQISKAFVDHRQDIEKSADGFQESLGRSEVIKYGLEETERSFTKADLDKMFAIMKPAFDTVMGGTDRAPKFPMPSVYAFLLRYYSVSHNQEALTQALLTLDKMAYGGIYDQIGGGFARYSTDGDWFAPHFEKMLYDDGQLMSLYSEAYQINQDPQYKDVVYETLEWLESEMTSPEGGFYSAQDADSEGEEGKFYVWEYDELSKLLGSDIGLFSDYYNVKKDGNWEHGRNILIKAVSDKDFALLHSIGEKELREKIMAWKELLVLERSKRIYPGLDDKILASWNGLMLKGLVDAYRVFGDEKFLKPALKNAAFLKSKMGKSGMLFHNYKSGKPTIDGYLEDYAFVIEGFIALYEATFDEQWLNEAIHFTNYVIDHFYDEQEGLFFFTADNSEKLIARKKEIFDNVIPGSNSAMARNMYRLGILLYKDDWRAHAESMLSRMKRITLSDPNYVSNWASLFADLSTPTAEIAIVGKNCDKLRRELDAYYIPNKVVAGAAVSSTLPILQGRHVKDGETQIYVCYDKTCRMPVSTIQEALEYIVG